MALSRAVTVTDEPTRLDSTSDGAVAGLSPAKSSIAIWNPADGETVFIGGTDVTIANGAPVAAGSWGPGLDLAASESLWAVVDTGPVDVIVLEVGV